MSTRYAIRRKIVHEAFDDEAIVVDLETGSYYALAGSAGEIWKLVIAGASTAEVIRAVRARYDGEPSAIESAVCRFLDELERERLIVAEQASHVQDGQPEASDLVQTQQDRAVFEVPVLA